MSSFIVRRKVHDDGSCFFHSIMYAMEKESWKAHGEMNKIESRQRVVAERIAANKELYTEAYLRIQMKPTAIVSHSPASGE
ncbi:unnamed protein product, partial [Closterium sp. Naga37s-1]